MQGGQAAVPPGLQGVNVGQQGMFMSQGGVGGGRVGGGFTSGGSVGVGVGGVVGVGQSSLQGPLAFLEKTTSNIGMPERRSWRGRGRGRGRGRSRGRGRGRGLINPINNTIINPINNPPSILDPTDPSSYAAAVAAVSSPLPPQQQ